MQLLFCNIENSPQAEAEGGDAISAVRRLKPVTSCDHRRH
ncbi:hypothetical protein SAMN04488054_102261 [Salibacterium qingdaonense]|uniref:Uncharacterized protein n=1 Tax=Salibacterium qingdaonense TaxID=266892 RepID=A0A1I4IX47_9BACI|nr:hypothetical protein SAMN04488054_102261 [Salibacterium qingdaonense]